MPSFVYLSTYLSCSSYIYGPSEMVKEECLRKGVCEKKRSGPFINPVSPQVGEKEPLTERKRLARGMGQPGP